MVFFGLGGLLYGTAAPIAMLMFMSCYKHASNPTTSLFPLAFFSIVYASFPPALNPLTPFPPPKYSVSDPDPNPPHIILETFANSPSSVSVLLINAIAILSEDRFLARIGWTSSAAADPGFGAPRDDASVKARLVQFVSSVRTLMRSKFTFFGCRKWRGRERKK